MTTVEVALRSDGVTVVRKPWGVTLAFKSLGGFDPKKDGNVQIPFALVRELSSALNEYIESEGTELDEDIKLEKSSR